MAEDRDAERPEPADTQVRQKRRRWWLWLPLWGFGLILLVGLAGWAVVGGRSRVRWKEFQARHGELRTAVLARSPKREPLEGEGVPGNAFDRYELAYAAYEKLTKKEKDDLMNGTLSKRTPEMDVLSNAVLDAHPEILAPLRESARCDTFAAPYAWESGLEMPLPWLSHIRLLSRVVAIDARRQHASGNLDAALDSVALGFQLGADVGRSGVLICWLVGISVRGITMVETGPIAADPALTAAQAERLEKLMVRLEEDLTPLHAALDADRLAVEFTFLGSVEGGAQMMVSGEEGGNALGKLKERASYTWRHGGSWRLAFAEADERLGELSGVVKAGELLPSAEASARFDKYTSSLPSDPLVNALMAAPQAADNSGRKGLARIRLVRAVCHERRTGAPANPLPLDPHTLVPLHRRAFADKTVYWAEGEDGDQGGVGTWEDSPRTLEDIPLEWKTYR